MLYVTSQQVRKCTNLAIGVIVHCAVVELKDSTLSKSTGMSGQEGLSVCVSEEKAACGRWESVWVGPTG